MTQFKLMLADLVQKATGLLINTEVEGNKLHLIDVTPQTYIDYEGEPYEVIPNVVICTVDDVSTVDEQRFAEIVDEATQIAHDYIYAHTVDERRIDECKTGQRVDDGLEYYDTRVVSYAPDHVFDLEEDPFADGVEIDEDTLPF